MDASGTFTSVASGTVLTLQVHADAPGNDHQNLNGEYVIIRNGADTPQELGGWRLCDAANHCYRFPDSTVVPPGKEITVFSGMGGARGLRHHMRSNRAIWNNNGDTATLYDRDGKVVAQMSY